MTNKEIQLENIMSEMPDFIGKYLRRLDIKIASKIAYANQLKYFIKYLSEKKYKTMLDITEEDLDDEEVIESYIADTKENNDSEATFKNRIKQLKMLYDYLRQEGKIQKKFKFPNTNKHLNSRVYGEEEYIRLIKRLDDIEEQLVNIVRGRNIIRNKLLFELMYRMGLKTSECSNLRIKDIDLKNKNIRIMRENETYLQMDEMCYALAESYYEMRLEMGVELDDSYFVNQQGTVLSVRSIEIIIKSITKDYYVEINPSILRLLCGAKLCKQTGDLKYVSCYLGISYETALDHYSCINRGIAKRSRENGSKIVMYL